MFSKLKCPIILVLSFIVSISGCGYRTKSDLLGHIDTVTLSRINNETQEYGLEEDMTAVLKREFSRHWGDGSDSLFSANIRMYELLPIALSQANQPEQYRLIINMSFIFEDLKRNRILRNEKNYEKMYDFYVVSGRGKPPETLKEAKQNLIEETAKDIVSGIVEEW